MASIDTPPMAASVPDNDDDIDWEEWDGNSPFLHHCLAGSVAGIAEHTLLYPVDTVKTHMQSYCADCPMNNRGGTGTGLGANANYSTNATVESVLLRNGGGGAAREAAAVMSKATSSCPKVSAATLATAGTSNMPSSSVVSGLAHMNPGPATAAATGASSTAHNLHPGQHGMWRTMKNLVYQGHPTLHQFQPRIEHVDSAGKRLTYSHAATAAEAEAAALLRVPAAAAEATTAAAKAVAASAESAVPNYSRLWRGVQTMVVGCAPAHALYFSSYEAVKAMFVVSSPPDEHVAPHLSAMGSAAAGATATLCHDAIMTPLDTIKQRLQLGHYTGMADAATSILRYEGYAGLYRSFPITLATNVPYGIVMVSVNESLKEYLNPSGQFNVKAYVLSGCGAGMIAAAVTTPLDRVKTRLQTQTMGSAMAVMEQQAAVASAASCDFVPYGTNCDRAAVTRDALRYHAKYAGFVDAMKSIVREEGYVGLFRGMTPRLLTHTPAVAISWTTYESAKRWLSTHFLD